MSTTILVTGGTGYIGSHMAVLLLQNNFDVVIIDNLSNSQRGVIDQIQTITGKKPAFYQIDLCNKEALRTIFMWHPITAVLHFAGLKAVGESVSMPLKYYHNNLLSTIILCEVMTEFKVTKLVFSSSATVYGNPQVVPIVETHPLSVTNPYGQTKLMIEKILQDLTNAQPEWHLVILRYFNPIGAHPSGLIGENPRGIPNNLVPYLAKVAKGQLPHLNVFGDDYETPDGTGIRDYIHVMDLVEGHLRALESLLKNIAVTSSCSIYNLGTGKGTSVLELIKIYEKVSQRQIPYQIVARRPGDVAQCYADPSKAQRELGLTTSYTVEDMCRDSWKSVA